MEGLGLRRARGRTDVPKIVDWYMDKKIAIDELITHRLPLEDINHGFELMKRGESIGRWCFTDRSPGELA